MIINTSGGGRRVSVANYASAESFPSSAPSNTIGIVSSAAVGKVSVQVLEPDEPTVGDVWVRLGNSGIVNIPVAVNVIVTPIEVLQYELKTGDLEEGEGPAEWKQKFYKVFQDGEWKSSNLYIFKAGDPCTSASGGWEFGGYGTLKENTDNWQITNSSSGQITTKNSITNRYSKLHVDGYGANKTLLLFTKVMVLDSDDAVLVEKNLETSRETIELDISASTLVNKPIKVAIQAKGNTSADASTSCYIYNVWFD